MADTFEDDVALLPERLHAARVALREAYDRRDGLADEAAAAERSLETAVKTPPMLQRASQKSHPRDGSAARPSGSAGAAAPPGC